MRLNGPLSSPAARYTITREIAAGGMATVYLGRLAGPGGFSRSVAIKRPHPHVARHPEFRAMLLDEGRLAASISHPNVVSTLDVVADGDDLFLVMEYVPGATLAQLQRIARDHGATIPASIACAIVRAVLEGLSAVHTARDEHGEPLGIVHRDISPQNILVGHDGVARILDFGVAKAARRIQVTRDGQLKGKIAYMAPEQMQGNATARTDVYAASIVLWEALTGRRLFSGDDEVAVFSKALAARVDPPSQVAPRGAQTGEVAWSELDAVVLRGLAREPDDRFASAKEMALALEQCIMCAGATEIAAWLGRVTAQPDDGSAATEGAASAVTVQDGGPSGPVATRTAPEIALPKVGRPIASPPPPRRRLRRFALGGAFAMLLSGAAVATLRDRSPARSGAPATPISTASSSPPVPATIDIAPSDPIGTGTLAEAPTASATPHERAKPPPKNRVERGHRIQVVSPPIDVSHAIDERH